MTLFNNEIKGFIITCILYDFVCMPTKSKDKLCNTLTHCIQVDSSTVICWMSSFVILEALGYFVAFILFLMENPVSKKCRPCSDATLCGI